MTAKSTEQLPAKIPATEPDPAKKDPEDADPGGERCFFDAEAASIVLSIFSSPAPAPQNGTVAGQPEAGCKSHSKTAGVKFMITAQDEKDLRELGYSEEQINKLKPEEAARIIKAGARPGPAS
jgi:hypothetical protein